MSQPARNSGELVLISPERLTKHLLTVRDLVASYAAMLLLRVLCGDLEPLEPLGC